VLEQPAVKFTANERGSRPADSLVEASSAMMTIGGHRNIDSNTRWGIELLCNVYDDPMDFAMGISMIWWLP
jgi:hypothetical protein